MGNNEITAANESRGHWSNQVIQRPGIYHRAGWLFLTLSIAISMAVVIGNDRQLRVVRDQIRERHQLKLRVIEEHIRRYLEEIWTCLELISSNPHVKNLSRQYESEIQTLYQDKHVRHRLSEIYVIERSFDGTHAPFMTFEMPQDDEEREDLHSLEREREEYMVQVEQIRRFAEVPTLESQISEPVMLCVGEPGVVCSMPILAGGELRGIVAGMTPLSVLVDAIESSCQRFGVVLLDAHGVLCGCSDVDQATMNWFRAHYSDANAAEEFRSGSGVTRIGPLTVLISPENLDEDSDWHCAFLYNEAAALAETGAVSPLAGWGSALIIVFLGGAVMFLCRMAPALLAARQEAEQRMRALADREAWTRAVVETAAEGIVTLDERGVILTFNRAAERIFRYSGSEVIGRNIAALAPELSRRQEQAASPSAFGALAANCLEQIWEGRRRDGTSFPMEIALSEIPTPEQRRFAGIFRDVTERVRAEEALRRSQTFLQDVVDAIPETIMVIDGEYKVVLANRTALEQMGNQTPSSSSFCCHRLSHHREEPCARSGEICPLDTIRRTHKPLAVTHMHLDPDGRERWMEIIAAPIFDERGEVSQIIESCRDVTERIRSEEEARQRQAELTRVARLITLGEMATGLAHELNQPLAAIVNYLQAGVQGLRSGADAERLQEDLRLAGAQAKRAGEIIDQIRQFVSREKPHRERVNLNRLIGETLELLRGEIRQYRVRVAFDLDDDLPEAWAERVQITQVLVNLLRNALEAMNAVKITDRRITIATRRAEEDILQVSVSDTGVGLPPQADARLFERFYTTKADGMGMGLSIARSIVEKHGGRLWTAPNQPAGTIFSFSLRVDLQGEKHDDELDGLCRG